MARTFLVPVDLAQNELLNPRAQNLASPPSSPVKGQFYFDTGANVLNWWDGTSWQAAKSGIPAAHASTHNFGGGDALAANGPAGTPTLRKLGTGSTDAAAGDDARFAASPPNGAAGGDLLGSNYPNPVIANGAVTSAKILDGTIVPADVNAANVDGADAAPSLRTLGLTGGKAMPGRYDLSAIANVNATANNISMGGNYLTGLPATPPPQGDYAASKAYVDSVAQGLDAKASVKVASTANLGLSGLLAIDGVTPGMNDRILVKSQLAPGENGIYLANSGAWTRASDADTWSELTSAFTFVEEGTTNADTGWVCTANATGTLGTTPVNWTQFSSAGAVVAGQGLSQVGQTINIGGGNGIIISPDNISVDLAGTGSSTSVARYDHNHDTTYPPMARTISTTAPLTGGGDLSANRTLAISNFTASAAGAVPSPGSSTGRFLKDDGTWAVAGGTVKKVTATCAAATSTAVDISSINSRDCSVSVYRSTTPWDEVDCDVEHTSATSVTIRFATAPAAGAYNIVVTG